MNLRCKGKEKEQMHFFIPVFLTRISELPKGGPRCA